ncbi:MAG: UvrD-helicase domain-containing protein [Patescibacteria group bacterium]
MAADFKQTKNLNDPQREAVEYTGGPILIAAGAGSGKTKTLTSRLARLIEKGVAPSKIVAITFTNKAANEMRERVAGQLATAGDAPFIGTFHSFCARILKDEAHLANRSPNFTIYDADDSLSLIKKIMKAADISKDVISPAVLQNKISQIKSEMLSPDDFDKITKKIYEKYETALTTNNAFDFDDLITKVVQIFENRPEILKKYHEKYSHILVDEYQDINSSQYKLIRFLAEQQKNLSVGGDDQQAIYSFRGADFRNFLNFQNDWPDAKIVKLEQNYRSSGTIISAASAVVQKNKLQTPKKLWTENAAGEKIKIIRAASREEEAMLVAGQIGQIKEGSVAVLYRTNAQSRAIEQSLLSASIPYRIFGGIKFYERKEVKDLLAGLRLAYNPADAVSEERIGKTFDKKTAAYLVQELPRLGERLNQLELINFFMENANYVDYLQKEYKNFSERLENINELISFAGQFKTLWEFLEKVSLLQTMDSPASKLTTNNSRLTTTSLMTIHMAKGLEFDNVFVVGCSEGLLPHERSYGALDDLEEERRLMYVAMTRARKKLCLSLSGTPSRFVYEIPEHLSDFVDLTTGKYALPDEDEMYIEYE